MTVTAAVLVSCGSSPTGGRGFDAAAPADKIAAIQQAARAPTPHAIRGIVEQLSSDDAAVRLVAIATLQRLTGQNFGYRDFDPPAVRWQAIERWRQAVLQGQVEPASGSDADDWGHFNHG